MNIDMGRELVKDGLYKHFKGNVYQILELAQHTESADVLVVYKNVETDVVWARPLEMFDSLVDKDKYPEVEQLYRFELIGVFQEGRCHEV